VAETLEFQAEARQLLQLMVHSIYSNKDVFLRELISNSSDALDRLRLEAFLNKDLQVDTSDLHIDLEVDREARVLTVRDNGIGMSRDEVVALIGTIAKSGTAEFLRRLAEAKEAAASQDLIGQFGVGFYSTFMVADKVTLVTKCAGESQATRWESTGEGTYTLEPVEDAPQGTAVTLHLKPEEKENHLFDYTDPWLIREIIRRYSDFITWPIRMEVERTVKDGEATRETETLNSMNALWARARSEVGEEEYKEFYKHVSHDWNDPLETIHMRAEGTLEYQALLFIPAQRPFDLGRPEHRHGVQLYVKRVFIMDNCEALMPGYLRFVRGVVDTPDLSLNMSREILQQDRRLGRIRRRLVKKVLATVKDLMTADTDRYRRFWSAFGAVVKEGLLADVDNRETILDIASFASTHDAEQPTTLRQYVERMKDGQEHIYHMTGGSRTIIESSPHLEALRAGGFEVLILTDPVDEVWVEAVGEFDGKRFSSAAKGQVDLDTAEEKEATEPERDQQQKDFAALLSWLTAHLEDDVKQVRLSTRLTTSPACIVGDEHDLTPRLMRMYHAMGQDVPAVKRILEINPGHPLLTGLRAAHSERPDDPALAETAQLLYGMALLAEGGELTDPAHFARLLADRLARTL
jgi:molecular chaperone HtpG